MDIHFLPCPYCGSVPSWVIHQAVCYWSFCPFRKNNVLSFALAICTFSCHLTYRALILQIAINPPKIEQYHFLPLGINNDSVASLVFPSIIICFALLSLSLTLPSARNKPQPLGAVQYFPLFPLFFPSPFFSSHSFNKRTDQNYDGSSPIKRQNCADAQNLTSRIPNSFNFCVIRISTLCAVSR